MTPPAQWWIHQGDAVEWLGSLPDGSVDLIVTDPAYESLEKHRKVGTTTRLKHSKSSSNDWFEIFPNSRFPALFVEMYRVLKKGTHLYFYCDQETMFVVKPIAESVGFKFWKPLIWDKVSIGMGYHYRARYELILFFEKGKRKLNDLGVPDIISEKRIRDGYPTEKPSAVSKLLITQSTQPGDVVIDPFMGSGSTGSAALKAGREFWGNDLSETSISTARSRLAGLRPNGGTDDRPPKAGGKPRSFPVTDGAIDAPDGAVVDGYERCGDRWERLDDFGGKYDDEDPV